ncbi:uncharacterized protein LOC121473266 [Vulpes lagopus]|uniref:uncharacterized protein LOC121473266 n=1 Tax=Vulpes lagopus TaxID=494514 RepID=UPI001BC9E0C9|nr:uncharacterized protein LOC121473266 [Vulpes lagopus]
MGTLGPPVPRAAHEEPHKVSAPSSQRCLSFHAQPPADVTNLLLSVRPLLLGDSGLFVLAPKAWNVLPNAPHVPASVRGSAWARRATGKGAFLAWRGGLSPARPGTPAGQLALRQCPPGALRSPVGGLTCKRLDLGSHDGCTCRRHTWRCTVAAKLFFLGDPGTVPGSPPGHKPGLETSTAVAHTARLPPAWGRRRDTKLREKADWLLVGPRRVLSCGQWRGRGTCAAAHRVGGSQVLQHREDPSPTSVSCSHRRGEGDGRRGHCGNVARAAATGTPEGQALGRPWASWLGGRGCVFWICLIIQ